MIVKYSFGTFVERRMKEGIFFGTKCFQLVGVDNFSCIPIFKVPIIGFLGEDNGLDSILLMIPELW